MMIFDVEVGGGRKTKWGGDGGGRRTRWQG